MEFNWDFSDGLQDFATAADPLQGVNNQAKPATYKMFEIFKISSKISGL